MQEINLYELIKYYIKHWYVVLAGIVIGLIGGIVYNQFIQTPLYKSSATLLIVSSSSTGAKADATLINNYQELIKSRRVLESARQKLNISKSYESIVGSLETSNTKDTEVIDINYSTTDPKQSRELLSATIDSFREESKKLYSKDNIQVVDSANLPTEPYNVNRPLQLLLATAIGLIAAIIVLFFIYDYQLNSKSNSSTRARSKKSQKSKNNKPKTKRTSKPKFKKE